MDVRPQIEPAVATQVLSASFNNDRSCFAVGLNTGICIFHTKSCLMKASRDFNAGIGLVQMMNSSNYLALVGGGRQPKFSNNKVIIWDDMRGSIALEISSLTPVRGVKLSRTHIIVVLQNRVSIYAFKKNNPILSENETVDNPLGVCALSDHHVAFPGRQAGHINLVDLKELNVSIIPAHSSSLRDLQFSPDGEMIATASETGTLIRVFATSTGARVAELRRGIDPARIFSIAFSPSGTLLACTSDKATLHVFDIPHPTRSMASKSPSPSGLPSSSPTSLLPSAGDGSGRGKWGILSRLPLMPRAFSDVYSFAQAPFETGDESLVGGLPVSETTTLGTTRPAKGLIGWISDESIVVIGAGHDARWEKFSLSVGQDGRRRLLRDNWKKYLGHS
ncbi:SVP1-like protein 2 [Ceratocystis fimbriata CBS 114723]|uniref:SVP1-like protein 2 n=1 Tax=Ceratocystis fimbriata CBS 114723 TaxID=1035309 RepID=A0A2C5XB89_9PEZI|nr:SVP1-like protein 2 [Ceratocystis fimbriata CBS 114723]